MTTDEKLHREAHADREEKTFAFQHIFLFLSSSSASDCFASALRSAIKIWWKKINKYFMGEKVWKKKAYEWMDLYYEIFWQALAIFDQSASQKGERISCVWIVWTNSSYVLCFLWILEVLWINLNITHTVSLFSRPISISFQPLIDMTWFSVFHSVQIHCARLTVINLSNCNFSLIAMNFVTLLIMIKKISKKKNVSNFFRVFLLPQRKVISFNFQFYSTTQGHSSKKMKKIQFATAPNISRSVIGKIQKSTKNYLTANCLACD